MIVPTVGVRTVRRPVKAVAITAEVEPVLTVTLPEPVPNVPPEIVAIPTAFAVNASVT